MKRRIKSLGFLLALATAVFASMPVGAEMHVSGTSNQGGAENGRIREIEFKQSTVQDAARIISELTGVNIIATNEAGLRSFTLFLRDVSVKDAIDSIARVSGLWYRRNEKTGVFVVMTTEEYSEDIVVFREESTRVFTLRFQNVATIARTIEAVFGEDRVELDLETDFGDELQVPGGTLGSGVANDQFNGSIGSGRFNNLRRNFDRQSRRFGNQFGRYGAFGDVQDDLAALRDLTGAQIELLERNQAERGDDPIVLSEEALASVRRRSRVPIFVATNREHNLLFVRSSDDEALDAIASIVIESDRPTPQVLLEMKVMAVELQDGYDSAFDLSYGSADTSTGPPDGQPPNPLNPSAPAGPEALLGLVNSGVQAGSTLVFQLMNDHVRFRIQLLEGEGRIKILATPILLASNNRPAKIFIGEQTVLTTGFTAQSVDGGGGNNTFISTPVPVTEVAEVGNTLTILPSINADRTVLMRILQESSQVNPNGAQIPLVSTNGTVTQVPVDTVDTSTLEGTAMAKDGLTVVIGGMINDQVSETVSKIPVLGDLPVMGILFRDTSEQKSRRELVLLITPHVFTTPEEAEAISRQRIDALTDHPSSIDIYLDELDSNRAQTEAGRETLAAVAEAAGGALPSIKQRMEFEYIELTRFASEAVRRSNLQANESNHERVRVASTTVDLMSDTKIEVQAAKSWRDRALYVTSITIINRDSMTKYLDERSLQGQWLAAVLEKRTLAPGESTYGHLVSDRPFERAAQTGVSP